MTPAEFLAAEKTRFEYYQILENWSRVFGKQNITVRIYEQEQLQNGLLADFLDAVKICADAGDFAASKEKFNTSINGRTLKIMRFLNKLAIRRLSLPLDFCRKLYIDRLQYSRQQKVLSRVPSFLLNDAILSPDMARSVISQFSESNERIAKEYLGREDGRLFSEPLP